MTFLAGLMRLPPLTSPTGLRHSVFVTSWLVSSLTQFLIITLLVSVVCNVFMVKTAFSMVFLFTLLFCTASLAFAFLVSVFFTNAILAAVVTPMLFFAMVLPRYVFFGSNRYEDAGSKTLASLLAPTAYAFGSEILGDYEYSSVGVSTANWGEGDYSFSTSLTMLFIDTIIYFFLGLYLERVIPSRYGRQLQPLFLLDPRWWLPPRPTKEPRARAAAVAPPEAPVEGFEPVPESLRSRDSIEIVGLVKTYGSGKMKKTAVDGLDLSLYESQITCLLGHNGAGKTTTLSVLTGLYTPTAGDCYVFGWSIKRCAQKVYEMMGICPQHDVLWSRLSVLEHLEVYASFKGVPKRRRAAVVEKLCGEIGLWDKRHTLAAALSGGMKRKLSVGCALIGGSRAVLLDEPSSGMDPASRRSLWDLLKRKTAGRVMVLTTHYMDEADLLADRIAVMSVGKLKCYGSSVYLKSRFGLGYTLSMLRVDARRLTDQHGQSTAERAGSDGHATVEEVASTLRRFVPGAQLLSSAGNELAFRLPLDAAPAFPPMLRHLDASAEALGLSGYGMCNTSMEEVFLRLSEGAVANGGASSPHATGGGSPPGTPPLSAPLVGVGDLEAPATPPPADDLLMAGQSRSSSKVTQLRVMLRKRWQCACRDRKGFFTMQVLPVLLVGLVLLILTVQDPRVGPRRQMSASLYQVQKPDLTQLVHTMPGSDPLVENVDMSALTLRRVRADNSTALSEYMLDTYNENGRNARMGAFVGPEDTVQFNIRVGDVDGGNALSDATTLSTVLTGVGAAAISCLADDGTTRRRRRQRRQRRQRRLSSAGAPRERRGRALQRVFSNIGEVVTEGLLDIFGEADSEALGNFLNDTIELVSDAVDDVRETSEKLPPPPKPLPRPRPHRVSLTNNSGPRPHLSA